jgi:hypothetical protein
MAIEHAGCPFHVDSYVSGLESLGRPLTSSSCEFSILAREVPGSSFEDGVGPWPYLYLDSPSMVDQLLSCFRDLITITVVTQPGYIPRSPELNAIKLKDHYVYDPSMPKPSLSRRSRKRLHKVESLAEFSIVDDSSEKLEFISHYRRFINRRNLLDSYVNFPERHFNSIVELKNAVFFKVHKNGETGAMACGVVYLGMLQMLHMVFTPYGLTWNASYLLMKGLQDYSENNQVRLLTGGMPDSAEDGLRIFKQRWANAMEPVYLSRIINNRKAYNELSKDITSGSDFFPLYRAR